jgi:flagellar basal body-associated protein FliL
MDMILASVTPSAADGLAAIAGAGVLIFVVWIAIGILLFLFPFIVMLQLAWLNTKLKKATDDQKSQSETASAWAMSIAAELKAQNALTRQLIRAYGHEPEA